MYYRVLSIHGLVAGMVGSDALLVCTSTKSSQQTLSCTPASDLVSFGGARATCSQTKDRVGGAGAAGHDWYTMRLNHVLTFEQQKSMLAWGKQALIEHMHCRGHSGVRSIVGVSFVVRKCYSPCFCSEARCGRDGPGAYV